MPQSEIYSSKQPALNGRKNMYLRQCHSKYTNFVDCTFEIRKKYLL